MTKEEFQHLVRIVNLEFNKVPNTIVFPTNISSLNMKLNLYSLNNSIKRGSICTLIISTSPGDEIIKTKQFSDCLLVKKKNGSISLQPIDFNEKRINK